MLAADTAVTSPLVTAVVALIIGVCGGGGLAALLRIRADRGKVVIEAAQGAVIVQTSVIEDLHTELARVKADVATLRSEATDRGQEMARLRAENNDLRALRTELEQLREENVRLRARVTAIEDTG
jgi:cell shape-determining protein MreC